ncbi:putative E3 ubiquitin-protein ligase RF298 [Iris pallida]|uniref:E3 ubiquitin-protein ligase RF298 n=1 Tax=Iris pallida TaxID=29817 RepID=A0AAX6GWF4_IRIPA|nr:putative E3 ubiquitin-protein ligase RF298 [Iris pallida]
MFFLDFFLYIDIFWIDCCSHIWVIMLSSFFHQIIAYFMLFVIWLVSFLADSSFLRKVEVFPLTHLLFVILSLIDIMCLNLMSFHMHFAIIDCDIVRRIVASMAAMVARGVARWSPQARSRKRGVGTSVSSVPNRLLRIRTWTRTPWRTICRIMSCFGRIKPRRSSTRITT